MVECDPSRAFLTPCRSAARLASFVLAFAAMVVWLPLHAQTSGVSGAVGVSSELVDRGLAVSPPTPILQGALSWTSSSGWSLGASAATEMRSPGNVSEALAQVSKYWSLSSDWQMRGSLLYYDYPGNARSKYFDRAEAGVDWIYRDVLTFGLSGISLTNGDEHRPRGAADVNFHWPLAWYFSFSAGAGVAQSLLSPYGSYGYDRASVYRYGQLGLIWSYGPWRMELDRVAVGPGSRQQWGNLVASPWVGTISWSF
jgi:hypothetical protein